MSRISDDMLEYLAGRAGGDFYDVLFDLRDARAEIARLTEENGRLQGQYDLVNGTLQALLQVPLGKACDAHLRADAAEARLAAATTVTEQLAAALRELHDNTVEYAAVNNLGGHLNHDVVRARAALTAFVASKQAGAGEGEAVEPKRIRHKKRGSFYTVIAEGAQIQTSQLLSDYDKVAVYRGDDGSVWVRPMDEMNDGRFEPSAPAPRQEPQR